MASRLVALSIAAHDPARLATYWAGVLGWDREGDATLLPPDDTGFRLVFTASDEPKRGPNQFHFDVRSETRQEQQDTVERSLVLGGDHLDIGQGPDVDHVVMQDPEGNEYCVIEPDNGFLADCPLIGALSGDGSQATGYFWSRALDWPLVWDQDEETAIRSPHGGSKLTWGGHPLNPKQGEERVQLQVAPVDSDLDTEVERLVGLGASRVRVEDDRVVLADPDGHELCVLAQ